jgi:hypothetical protein
MQVLSYLDEIETTRRHLQVVLADLRQDRSGRVKATIVFEMIVLDAAGEMHERQGGLRAGRHPDGDRLGRDVQASD